MYETHHNGVVVWRSARLAADAQLTHFVSTRHQGSSPAPCESLNLSFRVGDDPERVASNRDLLLAAVGVVPEAVVAAKQVHGTHVQVVTRELSGRGARDYDSALDDTDAMITAEPGICLLIMAADCVPTLLFDPVRRVVGAVHAGWRGTVARLTYDVVHQMYDIYGCNPADVMATIGPSIGPDDYEVGDEVVGAVQAAFPDTWPLQIHLPPGGRAHFDLWESNRLQLVEAGLAPANIEISGISTYANPAHFFSERRDHFPTGRFAAGIMLRP